VEKFREVPQKFVSRFTGNHGDVTYSQVYSTEVQKILSVSHAPSHRLLGQSDSDIGGPFFSNKIKWSGAPSKVALQGDLTPSSSGWKSEGVLVPPTVELNFRNGTYGSPAALASVTPAAESESSMIASGATAISRVAPTNPVFDGATALAELYSAKGLMELPGKSGNPGSIYLNVSFGVEPSASDIVSLADTAQRSEKILSQLEKDSGKSIRRKYEFPEEKISTGGYTTFGEFPTFLGGGTPSAYEVGIGGHTVTTTTTRTKRFAGAFTYHLPPKGTWRRKVSELDALYGVRPGIDTAWNAVPFSWLADYYGNMGDVLKNVTAFAQDGLILKYGYITSRTETLINFSWSYPVRLDGARNSWSTLAGSMQMNISSLTRMPANPFGFGPTGVALTGRQKANLAALGISLL